MNGARWLARANATLLGCFWLPCPLCGQHFGGQEWDEIDGHDSSIPDPDQPQDPESALHGRGICPGCTAAGGGCRAWHAIGVEVHPDCPALEAA